MIRYSIQLNYLQRSKKMNKENKVKNTYKLGKKQKKVTVQDTLIGPHTSLIGDLQSDKSIRIDGCITGNICCKGCITVGEQGFIKGDLIGERVVIYGKVEGNVDAPGSLEIMEKGTLVGDSKTQCLVVQPGGVLCGQSKMENK